MLRQLISPKKRGSRFKTITDVIGELRKVVWPSRQETVQTSLMVFLLVIILGLILWGLDAFLLWAVRWLTGQGG